MYEDEELTELTDLWLSEETPLTFDEWCEAREYRHSQWKEDPAERGEAYYPDGE